MTILSTVQKIRVCIFILLVLSILHPSSALPIFSATPVNCKLADFKTVVFFFLANYVSHAFTVPSVPGGAWRWSLFMQLGCIVYPFAGLLRSIALLSNHWIQGDRGSVGDAIAQGAMMVAVRSSDWRPAEHKSEHVFVGLPEDFKPPEDIGSDELPMTKVKLEVIHLRTTDIRPSPTRTRLESTKAKLDTKNFDIHGESKLPEGYHWTIPSIEELNALMALLERPNDIHVARSRSWLKGIIALAQTIRVCSLWAVSVPLGILRTAISDEAKQRPGSRISGEVGTLPTITEPTKETSGEGAPAAATDEGHSNIVEATPELDEEKSVDMSSISEERKRRRALTSGKQTFTATMLQAETRGKETVLICQRFHQHT